MTARACFPEIVSQAMYKSGNLVASWPPEAGRQSYASRDSQIAPAYRPESLTQEACTNGDSGDLQRFCLVASAEDLSAHMHWETIWSLTTRKKKEVEGISTGLTQAEVINLIYKNRQNTDIKETIHNV